MNCTKEALLHSPPCPAGGPPSRITLPRALARLSLQSQRPLSRSPRLPSPRHEAAAACFAKALPPPSPRTSSGPTSPLPPGAALLAGTQPLQRSGGSGSLTPLPLERTGTERASEPKIGIRTHPATTGPWLGIPSVVAARKAECCAFSLTRGLQLIKGHGDGSY